MKVWLLYDCTDRLEGVYSEHAKEVREQQFYEEALQNREHRNSMLTQEIAELKAMRKPYLDEAELLLDTERSAKESNNMVLLKNTRKQRKVLLKQAEKLTYEMENRETKIRNSQIMMKKDIMTTYGVYHYWQEEYVLEAD
jgi:hypothetical protein